MYSRHSGRHLSAPAALLDWHKLTSQTEGCPCNKKPVTISLVACPRPGQPNKINLTNAQGGKDFFWVNYIRQVRQVHLQWANPSIGGLRVYQPKSYRGNSLANKPNQQYLNFTQTQAYNRHASSDTICCFTGWHESFNQPLHNTAWLSVALATFMIPSTIQVLARQSVRKLSHTCQGTVTMMYNEKVEALPSPQFPISCLV